jgi:hypothetical protein
MCVCECPKPRRHMRARRSSLARPLQDEARKLTEIPDGMPAPDVDGQASLPRRVGPKGLPSTQIERTPRVCYVDRYGGGR